MIVNTINELFKFDVSIGVKKKPNTIHITILGVIYHVFGVSNF